MKGQVKTAFYLTVDHRIRNHIIKYTEEETFRVLGIKLVAFIALLYTHGVYQTQNLDV